MKIYDLRLTKNIITKKVGLKVKGQQVFKNEYKEINGDLFTEKMPLVVLFKKTGEVSIYDCEKERFLVEDDKNVEYSMRPVYKTVYDGEEDWETDEIKYYDLVHLKFSKDGKDYFYEHGKITSMDKIVYHKGYSYQNDFIYGLNKGEEPVVFKSNSFGYGPGNWRQHLKEDPYYLLTLSKEETTYGGVSLDWFAEYSDVNSLKEEEKILLYKAIAKNLYEDEETIKNENNKANDRIKEYRKKIENIENLSNDIMSKDERMHKTFQFKNIISDEETIIRRNNEFSKLVEDLNNYKPNKDLKNTPQKR